MRSLWLFDQQQPVAFRVFDGGVCAPWLLFRLLNEPDTSTFQQPDELGHSGYIQRNGLRLAYDLPIVGPVFIRQVQDDLGRGSCGGYRNPARLRTGVEGLIGSQLKAQNLRVKHFGPVLVRYENTHGANMVDWHDTFLSFPE
jgi:hypothetical protein